MRVSANPRVEREQQLYDVAENQAGYFTAAQAKELGFSYRAQHHHAHQGTWLNQGWGIYRLRNYPNTPGEQLVRLALWSRNRVGETQAVVSHETAVRIYEISDVMPSKIHLSVPKSFRKPPPKGVVLHKTHLDPEEICVRHGYQITTPLRTLLDVANSDLSPEHLMAAVTEALEKGLSKGSG
jgi:predicted transcriptional regulator of viral defense system